MKALEHSNVRLLFFIHPVDKVGIEARILELYIFSLLVVILLMSREFTIEYMLQAYEEGLVQTGEYVFIAFHLDPHVLVHKVRLYSHRRLFDTDTGCMKIR